VLHPLQHLELVVDHLLVALDILLQDNLHGHLARRPVCLSDDTICSRTERPSKAILGPINDLADSHTQLDLKCFTSCRSFQVGREAC
jgi:hypothetical protein